MKKNIVSLGFNGFTLCRNANIEFKNLLDFIETGNYQQLQNSLFDVITNEEFVEQFDPTPNQYKDFSDTTRIKNLKQNISDFREKRINKYQFNKMSLPKFSPHSTVSTGFKTVNLQTPSGLLFFDLDNFFYRGSKYISSEEESIVHEYFKNRQDCVAITRSVSGSGFHYYLRANYKPEQFTQVYFYTLLQITNELKLDKPIFDVEVGVASKCDFISSGVEYRNDEAVEYDYTELDLSWINVYELKNTHLRVPPKGNPEAIDVKLLNFDYLPIGMFRLKPIEPTKYIPIDNPDYDIILRRLTKNIDFNYSDDGNNLCIKFVSTVFQFNNIPESVADLFFSSRTQYSKKLESKYKEAKQWIKQQPSYGSKVFGSSVISKKKIITQFVNPHEEDHLISKERLKFLSGSEKIKAEWILPIPYLYLKADTKSGKTYSTVMARMQQKGIYDKVVLIAPTVDIILDKEKEFKKLGINCQAIYGKNKDKGYNGVSINDVDWGVDLFLTTGEGFQTKLDRLRPETTHLIVDEIHSYIQTYPIKFTPYEYIKSQILEYEYKTVTLLTGTPIENRFFNIFEESTKFVQMYVRYTDHVKSTIKLRPKINLNGIVDKIFNDYNLGRNVLFFNNSKTLENPAVELALLRLGATDICLVDSSHSVSKVTSKTRIIIATSTFEMGVGIPIRIDKIYINPVVSELTTLVSPESLLQMLNRTDRSRTVNKPVDIYIFSSLVNAENKFVDYDIDVDKFMKKNIDKAIQNHNYYNKNKQENTFKYLRVIDYSKQIPYPEKLNVQWMGYIEYKLKVALAYMDLTTFFNMFTTNQTEIENTISIDAFENEVTQIVYSLKQEIKEKNEEKVELQIKNILDIGVNVDDYSEVAKRYNKLIESYQEHFNRSEVDDNYIQNYIRENGFIKTEKDFEVAMLFATSLLNNDFSHLYFLAKNNYQGQLEDILMQLKKHNLFVDFNSKNIRQELLKYGIQMKQKRSQRDVWILDFSKCKMVLDLFILDIIEEDKKVFVGNDLNRNEIMNLKMFKELTEMDLPEHLIWKAVIRFAKLNNIPLTKRNRGGQYAIIDTRLKKGMKMTTNEFKELTGIDDWNEIKKIIKDSGFELECSSIKINGATQRFYELI